MVQNHAVSGIEKRTKSRPDTAKILSSRPEVQANASSRSRMVLRAEGGHREEDRLRGRYCIVQLCITGLVEMCIRALRLVEGMAIIVGIETNYAVSTRFGAKIRGWLRKYRPKRAFWAQFILFWKNYASIESRPPAEGTPKLRLI